MPTDVPNDLYFIVVSSLSLGLPTYSVFVVCKRRRGGRKAWSILSCDQCLLRWTERGRDPGLKELLWYLELNIKRSSLWIKSCLWINTIYLLVCWLKKTALSALMIQSKCLQRSSLDLWKNTRAPVAQHLTRIQKTKVQILAGSQCLLSLLSIKSFCLTNTQNSSAWSETVHKKRLQTCSFRWRPHTVSGHGGKVWEQGWCQPPSSKWIPRGNLTSSEAPLRGMCGNYVIHAPSIHYSRNKLEWWLLFHSTVY